MNQDYHAAPDLHLLEAGQLALAELREDVVQVYRQALRANHERVDFVNEAPQLRLVLRQVGYLVPDYQAEEDVLRNLAERTADAFAYRDCDRLLGPDALVL